MPLNAVSGISVSIIVNIIENVVNLSLSLPWMDILYWSLMQLAVVVQGHQICIWGTHLAPFSTFLNMSVDPTLFYILSIIFRWEKTNCSW